MNATLLQAFSEIDTTYVEQAATPLRTVSKKTIALRFAACAACFCLLIGGGLFAHFAANVDAHEVLARSPSDIPYLAGQMSTPGYGEVALDLNLSATVNSGRYDDAVFQVSIHMTDVSGPVFRQPSCRQEAKRLADRGLEVYTQDVEWTGYWGETVRRTNIVALLTKDQLEHFPVDERYGYMLSFTGDHVDLSEYTLIE